MNAQEDWVVEFQNSMPNIVGNAAYFLDKNTAEAWVFANHTQAGICVVSRRTVVKESWAVYGSPWPRLETAAPEDRIPAPVNRVETHFKG
jgi:acyl-CoA reductase-like NAD-dependent aldehyde dehydrogenase